MSVKTDVGAAILQGKEKQGFEMLDQLVLEGGVAPL